MRSFRIFSLLLGLLFFAGASAQKTFKVFATKPDHGSILVYPALPADSLVKEGTVLNITCFPDEGYIFDSGYYAPLRMFNGRAMQGVAFEYMHNSFQVTVDKDMALGASFMEPWRAQGYTTIQDVIYAKPGVKALKYDAFIPDGAKNLPGIVIIHGGGWSSNTEEIMRGEARELIKGGKYVVFSIDYRWIANGDGDIEPNTMDDLINDCYGAILHIQEHAAQYGLDPTRLAVTGDSAGGHLSASVANMVEMVGDGGFGVKPGVFEYLPTYMPQGMTAAQARESLKALKAAAPSYGVFTKEVLGTFVKDLDPKAQEAVSPFNTIPDGKKRQVPQYLTLGTKDNLIKLEPVQTYVDQLKKKGQRVELQMVEGASHAFFDWKPSQRTKDTFDQYGVPYAKDMLRFFDTVFYAK